MAFLKITREVVELLQLTSVDVFDAVELSNAVVVSKNLLSNKIFLDKLPEYGEESRKAICFRVPSFSVKYKLFE